MRYKLTGRNLIRSWHESGRISARERKNRREQKKQKLSDTDGVKVSVCGSIFILNYPFNQFFTLFRFVFFRGLLGEENEGSGQTERVQNGPTTHPSYDKGVRSLTVDA